MKKNTYISIGISAYNEEINIKRLIKSLLNQSELGFEISEIIVISDGSTDRTVDKVREIKNKKIKLIEESSRIGKSARLNQLLRLFKGDILILIDADILIKDKMLLSKIIKSGNLKKSGLVGINAIPYRSDNYFQKVLKIGTMVALEIAKRWNNKNNYLLFKGCFLALDRRFAKSIEINSEIINNDAYLYLLARQKGYSPRFIENVEVYYKSPKNFSDHLKQSSRFKTSQYEMQKYFDFDLNSEYKIPLAIYLFVTAKYIIRNPILLINYIFINALTKLKKENKFHSMWEIAVSTKK